MSTIAKKVYKTLVNKFIDAKDPEHKRSRRLYEGELHVPLHNFTGPGTRMDLPEVRNFPPYNDIDACSKEHDLEYEKIKKMKGISKEEKAKLIKGADRKAIECYDKHKDEYGYSLAKAGISGKMSVENLLSIIKGKESVLYGGNIYGGKGVVGGGIHLNDSSKELSLNVNLAISNLLLAHTAYLSNLSKWDQYVVWRYTIGSGQVNMKLIIGDNAKNTDIHIKQTIWTYQFFKYFNKTYSKVGMPKEIQKYSKYFYISGALEYINLSMKKKIRIANDIIDAYTINLQRIINEAPKIEQDIVVYKASTKYWTDDENNRIVQKPFNSSSYDPTFPFNMFMSEGSNCCLWQILVPKGSNVLSINPSYHAYPFEREILFPHGVTFDIIDEEKVVLDYIDKEKLLEVMQEVQDIKSQTTNNGTGVVIGEVYRLPIIGDTNHNQCNSLTPISNWCNHREVNLYTAVLHKF
jgi:hypothetical protein